MGHYGVYSFYNKAFAPQSMKDKHPKAAEHNINGQDFILFCETLEEVTGEHADEITDLSSMDLTNEQLDIIIDDLASETPTGREIQINLEQLNYIYDTRLKIEE